MPFAVLGIVLILVGLDYYKPGLLSDFGWIGRTALGIMFAAGGLYVVYIGMMTETKLDDIFSVFVGLLLFSLAAFFGFGMNVTSIMDTLFNTLKPVVVWILAATLGYIGLTHVSSRPGKYNQLAGLVLFFLALGLIIYTAIFR